MATGGLPCSPCHVRQTDNGDQAGSKARQYRNTKKLAVEYCKIIINQDNKNHNFLCNNKKKDDLSDCLLQVLYYITHKI